MKVHVSYTASREIGRAKSPSISITLTAKSIVAAVNQASTSPEIEDAYTSRSVFSPSAPGAEKKIVRLSNRRNEDGVGDCRRRRFGPSEGPRRRHRIETG